VQAKNVNINVADNVFLAFTTVQQIMSELSEATTEREKVAVITKAEFRFFTDNANNRP
jgi:hypothetical protein